VLGLQACATTPSVDFFPIRSISLVIRRGGGREREEGREGGKEREKETEKKMDNYALRGAVWK
jgi:hypothetical protein